MLCLYSSWFIHQDRNHSEMCEDPLKTYKGKMGSAEAKQAGMDDTQSRMHGLIPACGCII